MPPYVIWYKRHAGGQTRGFDYDAGGELEVESGASGGDPLLEVDEVMLEAARVLRSMVVHTLRDLARETAHGIGQDEQHVRRLISGHMREAGFSKLTPLAKMQFA